MKFYEVTRMHKATRTFSTITVRAHCAHCAQATSRERFPNDIRHIAKVR